VCVLYRGLCRGRTTRVHDDDNDSNHNNIIIIIIITIDIYLFIYLLLFIFVFFFRERENGAADCALRSRLTERKTHDAATPLWEKCCFRCNVVVVCTVQRST